MKNKISYAKRNQANKQEDFVRPIKIAKELGYTWHLSITGSSRFSKTNEKGETIYTPIEKIIEGYEQ